MGDPIRLRKKYSLPTHPWVGQRISDEAKLLRVYGLKSKTELWKVEALLRKYRAIARELIALRGAEAEKRKKILTETLARIGLLPLTATLDDVLSLELRDFLDRRIQTVVFKKGIAATVKEARQFITHGHIAYKGACHTTPGTIISKNMENEVIYVGPERIKPQTVEAVTAEPILKEKQKAVEKASAPETVEVE